MLRSLPTCLEATAMSTSICDALMYIMKTQYIVGTTIFSPLDAILGVLSTLHHKLVNVANRKGYVGNPF